MTPIYVSVGNLPLKIVPDTQAHADGHAVITYTYHLFKDDTDDDLSTLQNADFTLELNTTNQRYLGYITFDNPGRMFTYTSNGEYELETEDIEQVIEKITYYREHPELWRY